MTQEHNETYPVIDSIKERAHVRGMVEYEKLYKESIEDPEKFWSERARELVTWNREWDVTRVGDFSDVGMGWFLGGKLNACFNCVDRHLPERANETAITWIQDEPGQYVDITYHDLYQNVCRVANVLKAHGVEKGDRVCIYLPMIPELAYTMLACARIGAVHSIVFGGFSAEALRSRIEDAQCKIVVTADEGLRGGKKIPLKKITDDALAGFKSDRENPVSRVLVAKRTEGSIEWKEGRDYWLSEEMAKQRAVAPCEVMDAEDPLFILYTSGSTGKPKGVLHTTGGYLVYAAMTHKMVFDAKPEDVYFCAADIGWVTGHTYIVYGPLTNGGRTLMFESVPTYPDCGRYWQVVEDLKVNTFYTAPTALRALAQKGDDFVKKYDRSSLRILGSVGEPINPEIWKWYYDVVGDKRATIVDTWWQTETGGILVSPLPGVTPTKPGSATLPLFGIEPVLVEPETGKVLEGNSVSGALCLKGSWPGQARTIYGDHERFKEVYFSQYPGMYFTGDGCLRDQDGYYWITGRIDDVLNVSGHRLGTAEIESAIIENPACAEAAVVGYPHDIKGTGIHAYVVLYQSGSENERVALEESIRDTVRKEIGRFASPDRIQISTGLPKTRSGKVMRRILRKIACEQYDGLGDVSTLAEPEVVKKLISDHQLICRDTQ